MLINRFQAVRLAYSAYNTSCLCHIVIPRQGILLYFQSQLKVEITDAAKDHIIESAYDPIYGARPLKRFMQSKIETLLAREIIGGEIELDSVIYIDFDGSNLTIQ